MSRSYRVAVKESVSKVVCAEDRVSTQLEIIEVLPCDQMAALLEEELKQHGFEEKDGKMVRHQKGVTVTIEAATGTVTVSAEAAEHTSAEAEKEGRAYDDVGPGAQAVREQ